MGMAASQVYLLQLTSRKNQIGYELTMLSNQEMALTREMTKIAKNYQQALNQKTLKWSNNSGVSYIDLSYQNLMKPSTMNKNDPYLLTDSDGKVLIDSEYLKYAEMISSNGAAGGDWESVRTQVLSELTGIDPDEIESANAYQANIWSYEETLNKIIDKKPEKPTTTSNVAVFAEKLGTFTNASLGLVGNPNNVFKTGNSWSNIYTSGGSISLGTSSTAVLNLKKVTDNIAATWGAYLDDPEKLQQVCDTFYQEQSTIINNKEDYKTSLESGQTVMSLDGGVFSVNVKRMLDGIMASYDSNAERGGYGNECKYTWNDIDSATYTNWQTAYNAWQIEYDAALANYNNSVSTNNQLFTSEQESLIDFYDEIFSAIADKGWNYNEQINDVDYLNQMLQNNIYTLTTVDRDAEYDSTNGGIFWDNEYTTNIASNIANIFSVNDSDAMNDALVEYEYQKSIINAKEQKIDTRRNDLETEQAAINQMIQSIEQIKNDNIDRTMDAMG